jgi:hypothetical protein
MAYYLLTVHQPGVRSYEAAAGAKHQIEARSLDDAQYQADAIIDNHYRKIDGATMRLFDQTGLLATRIGMGDWNA